MGRQGLSRGSISQALAAASAIPTTPAGDTIASMPARPAASEVRMTSSGQRSIAAAAATVQWRARAQVACRQEAVRR